MNQVKLRIFSLTLVVFCAMLLVALPKPALAHHADECSDVYTPLSSFVVDNANSNKSAYMQVMNETGVPWEMLAAIHYRETAFKKVNPNNGDGIFQFAGGAGGPYPPGPVSDAEFIRQLRYLANRLQDDYVWRGSVPREKRKLQASETNEIIIKDTLYSFNGRAAVYANQAEHFAYNKTNQPFEGSPYVVNRFDCARARMGIITTDGGNISSSDTRYGAFTVFARLRGESYWQSLWPPYNWEHKTIRRIKKASFGSAHQVFTASATHVFSDAWWPTSGGVVHGVVGEVPLGEKIVDIDKITHQDGVTQSLFIATHHAVYQTSWNGGGYGPLNKIIDISNIKRLVADIKNEGGVPTYRLYVLANDGPYEFWWREGGSISDPYRFWNINNGIDLVKSLDPDGKDEIFVATSSSAYRMKWPVSGDIQRTHINSLISTVGIEKQTLPNRVELLYTVTQTGVHETWWKDNSGFSDNAKIVDMAPTQVVDAKKTITNGYHQLYVATKNATYEYWWLPGQSISRGRLVGRDLIIGLEKSSSGSYQNLYTASPTAIYETWWGNGQLSTGSIIKFE